MDPIYVLRKRSSDAISKDTGRYIGVTCELPEMRLQGHIKEARGPTKNHRLNWLRSLDQPPIVEVIEWVLPQHRDEREKYWIALFRAYGHDLVNSTDGGEGQSLGWTPSPETRANMSAAQLGRKHTPETIEKMRVIKLGKEVSEGTRKKISEAKRGRKATPSAIESNRMAHAGEKNPMFGKTHSPEVIEKIKARRALQTGENHPSLGTKRTLEQRAVMSASRRGKKLSPEHKENIRLGGLRRWAKNRGEI